MNPDIARFWSMACGGEDSPHPSSGGLRAHKLAEIVLEHVGGLDDAAFKGFIAFAELIRTNGPRVGLVLIHVAKQQEPTP